jgi:MarR family transcriptional regulator, transcriptional regulator for hemolysin
MAMHCHNEDDLFFLIHDVAHLMRTRFDQQARAWGLTRAQCMVLIHLHCTPGMTQNEMAAHCEIEPITVARLVDRLEAGGYVERRSDPSDRRINRLHLKPAAEPVLALIKQSRELAFRDLTGDMPPETMVEAIAALKRMKAKLTTGSLSRIYDLSKEKIE